MKLPNAPEKYDRSYMNRLNVELERDALTTQRTNTDIEIVERSFVLRSPDGSRFKVVVSNLGVLSATAL